MQSATEMLPSKRGRGEVLHIVDSFTQFCNEILRNCTGLLDSLYAFNFVAFGGQTTKL